MQHLLGACSKNCICIADKCCMKICPRAENGCINQIGQWHIVVISHQYLPIEGFNSYCEAEKHILPHLYL